MGLGLAMTLMLASLAGCGDAPALAEASLCDGRPIRMGVASSLREIADIVLEEAAQIDPALAVEPIFGASSTHARQLRLGAPFDILVSADADLMDGLVRDGLIEGASLQEIARGELILLGRASLDTAPRTSSQAGVSAYASSTDLAATFAQPEVRRVAVPAEVVPLGRYARTWLRSQNLIEALEGKLVTTEHARATLSAVEAGHVDLAFAYRSDQRLIENAQLLGEFDPESYPAIRYVAALAERAARCEVARHVVLAWTQPETRRALARAGFSPAQDESVATAARRLGAGKAVGQGVERQ